MTVLAASALSWSKTSNHEPLETTKNNTHQKTAIPLSNACSSSLQLGSNTGTLEVAGLPASKGSGTDRRVTTARLLETGTSVSTSVDTSPVPERPGSSPAKP